MALLRCTRLSFPVAAGALPSPLPFCRVWDNDGEFLLIEAAYGLPRWLKPETAQNRLWLHAGAVHLVPLPRFAGGRGTLRVAAVTVAAAVMISHACPSALCSRPTCSPTVRIPNCPRLLVLQATRCWLPLPAWPKRWRRCGAVKLTPQPRPSCRWALGCLLLGRLLLMSHAGSLANTATLHAEFAYRHAPTYHPPCCLQAALAPRLSGYPARALEQMHVAHALVPAAVAHLLHAEPQLLAAAVEAFHYRDPDDVKVRAGGGLKGCSVDGRLHVGLQSLHACLQRCYHSEHSSNAALPHPMSGCEPHGRLPSARHGAGGPHLQPLPVRAAGAAGVCATAGLPHAAALRPTGVPGLGCGGGQAGCNNISMPVHSSCRMAGLCACKVE